MPEFIADYWWSAATPYLLEVGGGMLLGWWFRRSRRAAWPTVALYATLMAAALTVLLDSWWVPPARVRLERWAQDAGYAVGRERITGIDFSLTLRPPGDEVPLTIRRVSGHELVEIGVRIAPPAPFLERYKALSENEKRELIYEVVTELLRSGVGYRDLDLSKPGTILIELMAVTRNTTQEEFLRRVFNVTSMAKLLYLKAGARLGIPPKLEQGTTNPS